MFSDDLSSDDWLLHDLSFDDWFLDDFLHDVRSAHSSFCDNRFGELGLGEDHVLCLGGGGVGHGEILGRRVGHLVVGHGGHVVAGLVVALEGGVHGQVGGGVLG